MDEVNMDKCEDLASIEVRYRGRSAAVSTSDVDDLAPLVVRTVGLIGEEAPNSIAWLGAAAAADDCDQQNFAKALQYVVTMWSASSPLERAVSLRVDVDLLASQPEMLSGQQELAIAALLRLAENNSWCEVVNAEAYATKPRTSLSPQASPSLVADDEDTLYEEELEDTDDQTEDLGSLIESSESELSLVAISDQIDRAAPSQRSELLRKWRERLAKLDEQDAIKSRQFDVEISRLVLSGMGCTVPAVAAKCKMSEYQVRQCIDRVCERTNPTLYAELRSMNAGKPPSLYDIRDNCESFGFH